MDITKTYEIINGIKGPKLVIKTDMTQSHVDYHHILKILEDCEKSFSIHKNCLFNENTINTFIKFYENSVATSLEFYTKSLYILLYVIPEKSEDFDEIYGYFFKAKLEETI